MMTLSQLHAHVETLDTDGLVTENSLAEAKGVDDIIGKVCAVYQKLRPIFEFLTIFIFIPKKIRNAILSFMMVLDGLCPGAANPDL